MSLEEYIASEDFLRFQDETLRENACTAVKKFLEEHEPVTRTQLFSIPVVIQAAGLTGLKDLADNQINKNVKDRNKRYWFWTFVAGLLFDMQGLTPPRFALHTLIHNELMSRNLLRDATGVAEKTAQRQIRKANRGIVEGVMERALATYFEHFNCHYYYTA